MNKNEFLTESSNLIGKITIEAFLKRNETKHDVFVMYHAHVNKFQVDLHFNGWINEDDLYIKWLNYKDEIKSKGKRFVSYESYSEKYTKESVEINLDNKTQKTIKELNELLEKIMNLKEE